MDSRPSESPSDPDVGGGDAPRSEGRSQPKRRRSSQKTSTRKRRARSEPRADDDSEPPVAGGSATASDIGGGSSDGGSEESAERVPEVHHADVRVENVDEDALKVIRRLRRHGHQAYLVGGGVRDLLLNVTPKDFDIATSARPSEVKALFRNCRIIGRRFRLAHILFGGGKVIETATFRRDPGEGRESTDADEDILIRRDNVFGEPHEDARRRDFTINGLFYDSEANTVIDYVGGMADVRRRVVRTIGAPDVRFREDPVRILRAIKFSARLDLGIDPDVYDAMVIQRGELARAARPRLLEELFRLLRGGAAHRSYWLMWETGVLGVLLESLSVHLDDDSGDARRLWARLAAIDTLKKADTLPSDAVVFAALMYGPISEAMAGASDSSRAYGSLMSEVNESLAVPRRIKERVHNIVHAQPRLWAGKLGALPRRDYFEDAAALFSLECDARGVRKPEWLDERPGLSGDLRPRRRRRRRRR